MKEKIEAALAKLDPANANHWTEDGLPRVETIRLLAGDPAIKREDITSNFPDFKRQSSQPPTEEQKPAPAAPAPSPVVKQEVLAPAEKAPPAPTVPTMEEQLEALHKMRAEVKAAKDKVDQELADLDHKIDKLQTKLDEMRKQPGDASQMATIQSFLKSQHEQRVARGEAWKRFEATGLKMTDILPQRAPIDQALATRKK